MNAKPLTKILFVDDDRDILTIAQYCLEGLTDTKIIYLSSGEAAIQEAINFQPDLILLDVSMPKMDGIATVNALKLLPSTANIPVAFITAKVQEQELKNYLKLGIIDVIVKPFDPLTLADKIKNIWSKTQLAP